MWLLLSGMTCLLLMTILTDDSCTLPLLKVSDEEASYVFSASRLLLQSSEKTISKGVVFGKEMDMSATSFVKIH